MYFSFFCGVSSIIGLPSWLRWESACNAGDLGSIPGLGRSPGGGKGYPLQHSGLGNSRDYVVPGGRKESDMTEQLSLLNVIYDFQQCQQGPEGSWSGRAFCPSFLSARLQAPRPSLSSKGQNSCQSREEQSGNHPRQDYRGRRSWIRRPDA